MVPPCDDRVGRARGPRLPDARARAVVRARLADRQHCPGRRRDGRRGRDQESHGGGPQTFQHGAYQLRVALREPSRTMHVHQCIEPLRHAVRMQQPSAHLGGRHPFARIYNQQSAVRGRGHLPGECELACAVCAAQQQMNALAIMVCSLKRCAQPVRYVAVSTSSHASISRAQCAHDGSSIARPSSRFSHVTSGGKGTREPGRRSRHREMTRVLRARAAHPPRGAQARSAVAVHPSPAGWRRDRALPVCV